MGLLRASQTATAMSKEAFVGRAIMGAGKLLGKGLVGGGKMYGRAFKKNWMGTLGATAGIGGGAYIAGSEINKARKKAVQPMMPRQRGGYYSPYNRV